MKKPNADIEWYDDGLSLEEQYALKKESLKKKKIFVVSDNYHKETQDKIIASLRQKLAADEEYIAELESEKGYQHLKKQYNILQAKYNQYLDSPEIGKSHYIDKIKSLEEEVSKLKEIRDYLILKLNADRK